MELTNRYLSVILLLTAFLILSVAGCTPPTVAVKTDSVAADLSFIRIAPVEVELADGPGRIGILEPEVFLYDISEGGVFEFRADWSAEASRLAARSAAVMLKSGGYTPLVLPDPNHLRDFFHLKSRLRYHCNAFRSDFYAERSLAFDGTDDTLSFSIGNIGELCDLYGVDAFLYLYGYEEKFSGERRRLLREISAGNNPPAERTFLAVILAERSGRITWYKHILVHENNDMRLEEHSMRTIGALFE